MTRTRSLRYALQALGLVLALGATPAWAQERADGTARLQVPEILLLNAGELGAPVRDGDDVVQRVTLYVSANRNWALAVAPTCERACDDFHWRLLSPFNEADAQFQTGTTPSMITGPKGRSHAVIVEYRWPATTRTPVLAELQSHLSGS